MKTEYDKRHRVKDPDFRVGQQVLLKDVRIAPGSNRILTKRPYSQQPYIIKQIVQSHGAGPAYKLTDPKTAKDLRGLINHDRLKHYLTPRELPEKAVASSAARPCYKPADRILQNRVICGQQKFLVLFKDRQRQWLPKSHTGDGFLSAYIRQVQRRAQV